MEEEVGLARTIGVVARSARKALGLTQEDAAERIGISSQFYARIERGGMLPSVPTLLSLADRLRVSIDTLLGRAALNARPSPVLRIEEPKEPFGNRSPRELHDLRLLTRRLRRASPQTLRLLNLFAAALERE